MGPVEAQTTLLSEATLYDCLLMSYFIVKAYCDACVLSDKRLSEVFKAMYILNSFKSFLGF